MTPYIQAFRKPSSWAWYWHCLSCGTEGASPHSTADDATTYGDAAHSCADAAQPAAPS